MKIHMTKKQISNLHGAAIRWNKAVETNLKTAYENGNEFIDGIYEKEFSELKDLCKKEMLLALDRRTELGDLLFEEYRDLYRYLQEKEDEFMKKYVLPYLGW